MVNQALGKDLAFLRVSGVCMVIGVQIPLLHHAAWVVS